MAGPLFGAPQTKVSPIFVLSAVTRNAFRNKIVQNQILRRKIRPKLPYRNLKAATRVLESVITKAQTKRSCTVLPRRRRVRNLETKNLLGLGERLGSCAKMPICYCLPFCDWGLLLCFAILRPMPHFGDRPVWLCDNLCIALRGGIISTTWRIGAFFLKNVHLTGRCSGKFNDPFFASVHSSSAMWYESPLMNQLDGVE